MTLKTRFLQAVFLLSLLHIFAASPTYCAQYGYNQQTEDLNNRLAEDTSDDVSVKKDVLQHLIHSINSFSFNLYREISKEKNGNIFFSPYAIADTLGTIYTVTSGDAAEEILAAMNFDRENIAALPKLREQVIIQIMLLDQDGKVTFSDKNAVFATSYDLLEHELRKQQAIVSGGPAEFYYKSALWLPVSPGDSYKENIKHSLGKDVNQLSDAASLLLTEKSISSGVAPVPDNKTGLIASVIYFAPEWRRGLLSPRDAMRDFFFTDFGGHGKTVIADMLSGTEGSNTPPYYSIIKYMETLDFQAVSIPFFTNNHWMCVILPKERKSINEIEQLISPEILENMKSADDFYIKIKMPKFNPHQTLQLSNVLKSLKIKKIFTSFDEYLGYKGNDTKQNLRFQNFLHEAFAYFDNVYPYSSPSDRTIGFRMRKKPEVFFNANRPFVYFIFDVRNLILFMGRYVTPN